MIEQLNLFSCIDGSYKCNKPVLLIELFSGIGAQAKSLEILNIPFKHHKTCEWSYNSIIAYNAIHIKDNTDYSRNLTKEDLIDYLQGNISTNYNEPCDVTKKSESWLRNCYNNVIATHDLMNIMKVKGDDLDFDRETIKQYDVWMTYSFPCQDISTAGLRKGLAISQSKGGGGDKKWIIMGSGKNTCRKI